MPGFSEYRVSEFFDALASPEPTPGGGTAAAIAGAMGASLLMMVAGLTKTRGNTDVERVAMSEARAMLASVRDRFMTLADSDSDAFKQVMAAYRLPKASDEDKSARKLAVQHALRAASETPLETLRSAAEAIHHARTVARYGNPSATSDVKTALELLEATAAGAAANVETNLVSLEDEAVRKVMASSALELSNRLTEDAADARTCLL